MTGRGCVFAVLSHVFSMESDRVADLCRSLLERRGYSSVSHSILKFDVVIPLIEACALESGGRLLRMEPRHFGADPSAVPAYLDACLHRLRRRREARCLLVRAAPGWRDLDAPLSHAVLLEPLGSRPGGPYVQHCAQTRSLQPMDADMVSDVLVYALWFEVGR